MSDRITGTVKWFMGIRVMGSSLVKATGVFVHFSAIQGDGFRNLQKARRLSSPSKRDRRVRRRATSLF